MIAVDSVPQEIRESRRLVVWRLEYRDGRATKVPYQAHRPTVRAAVDDPTTWSTFSTALAVVQARRADGLGVVLGDGLVGIDLDHVRDPQTGTLTAAATSIVQALDSYTEISPSGTGVHVLAHGTLPPGRRRVGNVEMYSDGRYFTVTGQHVAGMPGIIEHRTHELAVLHARIFTPRVTLRPLDRRAHPMPSRADDDGRLLERARTAKNGAKFFALWAGDFSSYPSQSEADQALCNLLAWWTKGDESRVDRLFRQSGLMRPKWDERRGTMTYGERTVSTAVSGCRRGAA